MYVPARFVHSIGSNILILVTILGLLWSTGCSKSQGPHEHKHTSDGGGHSHHGPDGQGHGHHGHSSARLFAFVDGKKDNKWLIHVIHPKKEIIIKTIEVPELTQRTAEKAKATKTEDVGPGWGDAILSHDHTRIFANAKNADALVVINVEHAKVEKIFHFAFGDRPVHSHLPNHGTEVWVHLDGKGAFFVISSVDLRILRGLKQLVQCTSPNVGTGHGKMLYAYALGNTYFCTNTQEPALFVVNGKTKKQIRKIEVCGTPPKDDPKTPEDESKGPLQGGTHDKAYLPGIRRIVVQCTGGKGYALVNPQTLRVEHAHLPISGSIAHDKDFRHVLAIRASEKEKQIQVWEQASMSNASHAFSYALDVDGSPSARGTHFHTIGSKHYAWIPQTKGEHVAVVDLQKKTIQRIQVGPLTVPPKARHFSRRGALGVDAFYTYNDTGFVRIDLKTHAVTPIEGSLEGTVGRLLFVGGGHNHG